MPFWVIFHLFWHFCFSFQSPYIIWHDFTASYDHFQSLGLFVISLSFLCLFSYFVVIFCRVTMILVYICGSETVCLLLEESPALWGHVGAKGDQIQAEAFHVYDPSEWFSAAAQLQFSRWLTRVSLLICLRGDGCSLQLQQWMLGNGNNDFTGCNLDEASLVVLLFAGLTRAENF